MIIRPPLLATAALLFGLALASAAPVRSAEGVSDKPFRWAFQSDVQTLDPYSLFETLTIHFQSNFYEPLVARGADMEIRPALATAWENPEPDTWIFTLREGVTFHNGNAFDADDVLFSIQRIRAEGSDMKVVADLIKEARRIDDHKVALITPTPNPILPQLLEIFLIMDKEWSEEHGAFSVTNVKGDDEDNYANQHANGTGPFMLAERQPDVKTVLRRNPNWWGWRQPAEEDRPGHPPDHPPDHALGNVGEAIFTPIGQDATRVAALIAGDVDMAYPVPIQDWERLDAAEGVEPLTGPETRTIFLGFDQARDELLFSNVKGKNPFQDLRVRQAFLLAIDVVAIKDKVMRGAARPAGLMVAPQINGWSEALDHHPRADPLKAKALLAEAGYPNGFEVTLDCPNDRYVNDERICQAVAAMLARIGVKVDLNAQPRSRYFAQIIAQNDYQTSFYLLGWTPATLDSHNVLTAILSCRSETKGQFNIGGYCNPRLDELTDLIQVETDATRRQALIDEAFLIHQREVGHIPLHQQPLSWGVSDSVTVVQRPDNAFHLKYVQMK